MISLLGKGTKIPVTRMRDRFGFDVELSTQIACPASKDQAVPLPGAWGDRKLGVQVVWPATQEAIARIIM